MSLKEQRSICSVGLESNGSKFANLCIVNTVSVSRDMHTWLITSYRLNSNPHACGYDGGASNVYARYRCRPDKEVICVQLRSAACWPTWSYFATNRGDAVRQQWDLSKVRAGRQVWPASNSMSSWLTPGRLLFLFCAMNMLVYIDRGNTVPCWQG